MIKIQRLRCIKKGIINGKWSYCEDYHHIGRFTTDREYVAVFRTGMKTIKIYDDNINAVQFCIPDRCGFGKSYSDYTKYFEHVDDFEYLSNKKELRTIVIENQKFNRDLNYRTGKNIIRRIK